MTCAEWCSAFLRRKTLRSDMFRTPLDRCLTTFDLTVLGLAQMIGAGIFVLTGTVAHSIAGPSVILSFLIAGVAAVLSALCYAEFGSLIPRTGSAYLYTYIALGECIGFLSGWCILAEQIIGSATVARSFSGSIDALFDNIIANKTIEAFGRISVPGLSPYPDFLAILPILITTVIAVFGAKLTAVMNNVLTAIQTVVLMLIIILGFVYGNGDNWTNTDSGGFFPYGIGGTLSGAASCFFAFVGFDSISLAGEEAMTPRKSVPLALLISMPMVCVLYMLASSALTLMQPYYEIDVLAPFPVAFQSVGLTWFTYVVTLGSITALFTTLIASQYAMPRIIYAMSADGLLFAWMGSVNKRWRTPINAILMVGVFVVILAVLIDMEVLVELYSIGTLLTFTFVAISLIKLHYEDPQTNQLLKRYVKPEDEKSQLLLDTSQQRNVGKLRTSAMKVPLLGKISSFLTVNGILMGMLTCQVLFGICVLIGYSSTGFDDWDIWIAMIVFGVLATVFFIFLALHQTNDCSGGFRVPLSPLFETLSISINLTLMFLLQPLTWVRIGGWILLGLVVYILYGRRHSLERLLSSDLYRSDTLEISASTSDSSSQAEETDKPASYGATGNTESQLTH